MNTSIVIPLGRGSRWNDIELRFCLRSIQKHLTGYGDIFIIGEKPNWLQNIILISATDGDKTYNKECNIFNKIMIACNDERVTGDFLFMNDDHFLLHDYIAGEFPYYCHGLLSEFMTVTDYKHTIKNTQSFFRNRNPYYSDIHCPIVYNKDKFQICVPSADWKEPFGYCIKTIYCDFLYYQCEELIECPDLKINEAYPYQKIEELIAGRAWFSIGDQARMGDMQNALQILYPKKSKYEL